MLTNDKNKDLPVNPTNCWNFFLLYTINSLFTLSNIVYLIQYIVKKVKIEPKTDMILSNMQIVQTSFLSISILGYVIFQIPTLIAAMQHIFEEVPPTASFKKVVNWIIRSQWFLPLFYLSLVLTNNYIAIKPVQFVLVFFSIVVDLLLNNAVYNKNDELVLQVFSLCLLVLLVPYSSYATIFSMVFYKAYLYLLNKKTKVFLNDVKDPKTKSRMKVLGVFSVINMILMIYIVTNSIANIKDMTNEESQVFQTMINFFKSLIVPNTTKIVTSFMV